MFCIIDSVSKSFQFHFGSIGSNLLLISFKSGLKFQFHFGSIGRKLNCKKHDNLFWFQFHFGSIGRRVPELVIGCPLSFNSTLVRLEVLWDYPQRGVYFSFNSTLVRLEVLQTTYIS